MLERSPTPTRSRSRRQGPSNRRHCAIAPTYKNNDHVWNITPLEKPKIISAARIVPTAPERRSKLRNQGKRDNNDSPTSARFLQRKNSYSEIESQSLLSLRDRNHSILHPLQTPLQLTKRATQAIQIVDDSPISVIDLYPPCFRPEENVSSIKAPSQNSYFHAERKLSLSTNKK